ncbi:MAG: hypothetical protein GY715_22345 [Planctomycetes bacterium]|nr:hypothetical protein [Planctomycetota bacterium]
MLLDGSRFTRRLLAGLALVSMLFGTGVAVGQGRSPDGEAFAPDFRRRDLNLFVRDLKLGDNRKAVVEALLFDYETAFTNASKAVRDRIEEIAPAPSVTAEDMRREQEALRREVQRLQEDMRGRLRDVTDAEERRAMMDAYHQAVRELRDEMRRQRYGEGGAPTDRATDPQVAALMVEWKIERRGLHDQFIGDVEAVLTDEQRSRWPGVLRTIRRREMLGRGYLAGETVDLITIVGKARLDGDVLTTIQPMLEEYAIALDLALVARNETLAGMPAVRPSRDQVNVMVVRRTALRDVNVNWADRIADALPETVRPGFHREFRVAAFPQIYRPTPIQRLFESTRRGAGLTPDLEQGVVALEREYNARLDAANEALRTTTISYEPEQLRGRLHRAAGDPIDPTPGLTDDPIRLALMERREMGVTYSDRLKTLLGETGTPRSAGARDR